MHTYACKLASKTTYKNKYINIHKNYLSCKSGRFSATENTGHKEKQIEKKK